MVGAVDGDAQLQKHGTHAGVTHALALVQQVAHVAFLEQILASWAPVVQK
jgi:hypothetical protein